MLNNVQRNEAGPMGGVLLALVVALPLLFLVAEAQACNKCNCYPGFDYCGENEYCRLSTNSNNICQHRNVFSWNPFRLFHKLKDGKCVPNRLVGRRFAARGDIDNAANALDLWLQAYEMAGASGGGPPDATLVAAALRVPLDDDQHEIIRQVAIHVQGMYLGWTSYPNREVHRIGFFNPPDFGTDCLEDPYAEGDHGTVEPLDTCHLDVAGLIREAMVGELSDPDQGVFDSFMDQIPTACPTYETFQGCEFPHPDHGHPFPHEDGLACLNFVMRKPLTALMLGDVPSGICCDIDNVCVEVTQGSCESIAGNYLGDDTMCGTDGACLTPPGRCVETSDSCCAAAGGVYQGAGIDCPEIGACEFADSTCLVTTIDYCQDNAGVFQGDMTVCPIKGGCVRDPAWKCDGDVDGNRVVNPVDVGLVQVAFGTTDESALCQYDLDCDGQVNPVDDAIVRSLFGACEPPREVCP